MPRVKLVCEEGTGSEGMVLCVRWAVVQEGLEIGSHGSKGVTSPLSPRPSAPPPPPAGADKELAGAVMDETGEEGILAVKFPLPFTTGPRGALGQGEASRSHLGVRRSSWSWPGRCW